MTETTSWGEGTVSSEWRCRELGEFLRGRRERVAPEAVGMPTGGRRRVSGLRREEVAVLAHLSVTWYTHLEQGRDVRPSVEVLDNLARVLRLGEDESRYLHLLAHGASRSDPLRPDDPPPDDLLPGLVAMHADSPHPVTAMAHLSFDIIAWNPAATAWYGDWTVPGVDPPNFLDWLLFAPEARERLVYWSSEVRDGLARWRSHVAHRAADERVHAQIERYRAQSPEFAAWWPDHHVVEHRPRLRSLRHPDLGIRDYHVLPMISPTLSGGLLLHLPADQRAPRSPG